MPWGEKTVLSSRQDFVVEAMQSEQSFSSLCRKYGISRATGYKWTKRYINGEPLTDRSRAPLKKRGKTPETIEALILKARDSHPAWGPRKLKRYLENQDYNGIPARSTIAEILKRNDRIEPEASQQHKPIRRFERKHPNELWQLDFKGDFAMLDENRCHPLTVLDDCSRYSLCVDAKDNQKGEGVCSSFQRLFEQNGLPLSVLCDNGSPWGDSRNGYTQFELWMMQLDILPMHGRPLHPQTQGKEERFHLTMKKELLTRRPMANLEDAQDQFNIWRHEYNHERPHEAIMLKTPSQVYRKSQRKLPARLKEPIYDDGARLRKVNYKGYISINNHRYYLGDALIGKYIQLIDCEPDTLKLCYGRFQIAKIDLRERLFVSKKIYRLH